MNRSKVHMLRLVLWGAVAPALALGAPATGSPVVAEDGITIADLGPPGAAFSDTADINDLGQVVGYYNTDTEPPKAYLWTAEDGWTDLGNLEGGEHGQRHQRLGPGGGVERSYWRRLQVRLPMGGGGMTDLGTLGGANSWAKSINNLGQVAGVIERADGSRHAALWTVPIPVVTPEQAIADVAAHAAALVTGGTLSDGEGTALTVKLEAAQHQLDKGNAKLAANVLGVGAFINQVEAMVSGRRLTAEEAEPLSDSANAAIELIEAEPQRRSRLDHAVSRKRLRTPVTFGTSRTRSESNRMVFLPGQAR